MLKLQGKQYDLFLALFERAGADVPGSVLLEDVWGDSSLDWNILRVTMFGLRRTLRNQGSLHVIEPIPYIGYRMMLDHPIPEWALIIP